MNDKLRNECKMIKALQGISYKELAEYIDVKTQSFYSWIKGYYDFSYETQERLKCVLSTLKE